MPNYKQAPKLYHNKSSFSSNNYYNLPQELMDCVFQQLDGKCGNQIKLMVVLLGTLGNGSFGVSEKWICERTGMVQQTYNTARKALIEKGWIYLEDGELYVLPTIIKYGIHYPDGITEEEKKAVKIDTISKCVNDIKVLHHQKQTQYDIVPKAQFEIVSKAQCDIVYNINNNKNNKNINNKRIGIPSSTEAGSPIPLDSEVQEIDEETANSIIDKQYLTPSLILTSTGKYLKIKENAKK